MNEIIKRSGEEAIITGDVEAEIIYLERTIKELKAQYDALKAAMLEEMRDKGIIKVSTDALTVSCIAPTDRETFDSKAFRKDYPDLYDEYVSMKPVKDSIRIKVS